MSTVKIKQVEGLRGELDGKADATTVENKANAFVETTEQFTGITANANAEVTINLSKIPKQGFVTEVHFNGVQLTVYTINVKALKFTVPYSTEPSDTITVRYCY